MRKALPAGMLVFAFSCLAIAQVAILQIQVIEGEAAVHKAGARSSRPLTVEVTDETGKPVAGATVSFHLPDDGPGGVFASGIRTEVVMTDARGRATVHGLQANHTSGPFQVRITASKDSARAGTFSRQYVAGGTGAAAQGTPSAKSHRKWLVIGLAAGAATAAGLAAGMTGSSGSAPAGPATPPRLTIGAPVITIGRP